MRKQFSCKVEEDKAETLQILAEDHGLKDGAFIRMLVEKYAERHGPDIDPERRRSFREKQEREQRARSQMERMGNSARRTPISVLRPRPKLKRAA